MIINKGYYFEPKQVNKSKSRNLTNYLNAHLNMIKNEKNWAYTDEPIKKLKALLAILQSHILKSTPPLMS